VLSLHGEVTDPDVDVFDRERVFVERHLSRLVCEFPSLKVVLEHVTTREAAEFVAAAPPTIAATITPQHLLWSRNALFAGGLRPHFWCLPVQGQGECVLRRRLLHRATRAPPLRRGVRGGRRPRPAGGFRQPSRCGLLRPAAQRRADHARARGMDGSRRLPVRRGPDRAAARGRDGRLARGGVAQGTPQARCYPNHPKPARPSLLRGPGVSGVPRRRGKSGLRRAGCRVTPGRSSPPRKRQAKARNRATETSRRRVPPAGETRQPPSGATPSRRTTTLLAESAGRWLEPAGNGGPRRMTAIARGLRAP
jgi:hypothetical protein